MKHRYPPSMKRLSIAVSLAASMWACDGSSLRSPTEPPRFAPAAPLATYTLSGVVTEVRETGLWPAEGARVEVSHGRLEATTDEVGSYRIVGVAAGPTSVTVSTWSGYETVSVDVTIDGDTRLDIELFQRGTYTVSGVVTEVTPTGQAPVEDVEVWESYYHAVATTDAKGSYSFTGPLGGVSDTFHFAKEGYQAVTIGDVTIHGDTRLDVQLVRR
jgi:hypothetical protein